LSHHGIRLPHAPPPVSLMRRSNTSAGIYQENPMSNHSAAHQGSIALCEGLVAELARLRPGISRSEAEGACGILHPPHSRFAYVYHTRRAPALWVHFRCAPGVSLPPAPAAISITHTAVLSNQWARSFPARFPFSDAGALAAVARFLFEVAYPLSVPGQG